MTTDSGHSPELLAEAQEIVDAFNRDLIEAENETRTGDVDPERVNSLFRSAHSLKGISGMFGLEAVSQLAHEVESVLDGMRLGKVRFDTDALDVLFACVETFGELIGAAGEDKPAEDGAVDALVRRLHGVAVGPVADGPEALSELVELGEDVLSVLTEYEEHRLRENLRLERGLFILRSSFDLSNFDIGLAEIDAAVKRVGEVITKLPSAQATDPGGISFDIIVGSDVSFAELERTIADDRVEVIAVGSRTPVTQAAPPPAAVPEPAGPAEPAGPDGPAEADAAATTETAAERAFLKSVSRTVRVDIRRLDRLMNLIGELGLTRMAYQRLSDAVRRDYGFTEIAAEMHKEARNFERRLTELQAGIMEVRMVPLANLFERMVRMGRKMSRELGREVRIETSGEQTELDKLIIEDLADPLMHLIRNSIDHGIEPPDERVAAGKPREGVVRLSGAARGNHVIVTVSDDGQGIDVERTIAAAIENKLISDDRAKDMTRREVFNLLFLPGFSTRSEVSEYSGRGVGLDVVKTHISQLSGIIDVDSTRSVGTAITVTLPITLAIIPALIVRVAGQTYAVPLNNVQETLALAEYEVRTIERQAVISVRGATVPLIDFSEVFGLDAAERTGEGFGVIAAVGHNQMALVVDDLIGQQDIVIKALGRRMRNIPGIAGAAELGNQQTILVIDIVELMAEMAVGGAVTKEAG